MPKICFLSLQTAQTYSFTFDKVFNHEASQDDVFVEISQLVQSALDGYKVVYFVFCYELFCLLFIKCETSELLLLYVW